jgi:DNA repair protein RadC
MSTKPQGLAEKPHFYGHRDRLRDRFLADFGESLPDYELLELLLFQIIPRRDVKPLAKDLIARFGSFAETIAAPVEQLQEFNGMGEISAVALKTYYAAAKRLARQQVLEKPILSNRQAVIDYCRVSMAYEDKEQFRILFLNNKNILIADELQQVGTVNHTPVYAREVIKSALARNATALILVHNHPSGDPTPSRDDIEMTKKLKDAGKAVGVAIHDHFIVGKNGVTSFQESGLI